jgi:uncharacterized membrane protein
MNRGILCGLALAILLLPALSHAQSEQVQQEYLEKAEVVTASASTEETDPWSGVTSQTQTLTAKVLSGPDAGKTVTFENDFTQLAAGDYFYIRHATGGDGPDYWNVSDPYRLNVLALLGGAFLVLIFIFGGIQGVRGLVSLAGSLVLIFGILLPGIYAGLPPLLLSLGVSGAIIIGGSYLTHGVNRATTAAVLGMLATVVITGIGGWWAVHAASLSGFSSETNAYLNFSTGGSIDMIGLLEGGIMIGLLGVLYDIAIGQAVAVEELFDAGRHLTRGEVYRKGIRIGREHIGALINTLAIAYVGVSLPLLLLLMNTDAGILYTLNNELFATEIVRILMGGIGLTLAVPITTFIASRMLSGKSGGAAAPEGRSAHRH